MIRPLTFALVGLAIVVLPNALFGQGRRYPLITTDGLRLHNTTAAAVTLKRKRAVGIAVARVLSLSTSSSPQEVRGR